MAHLKGTKNSTFETKQKITMYKHEIQKVCTKNRKSTKHFIFRNFFFFGQFFFSFFEIL